MNTCQNGTIEPYLKLSNSSSYLFFSPYQVRGLSTEEFPAIPEVKTAQTICIPADINSGNTPYDGEWSVRSRELGNVELLTLTLSFRCNRKRYETLKEGLKGSLFATATDEGKHILTGVYFKICQYSLEFVATNDHLLVVLNTFGVETDHKFTQLTPKVKLY
jgi:DNA polymerase-3 subunit beta